MRERKNFYSSPFIRTGFVIGAVEAIDVDAVDAAIALAGATTSTQYAPAHNNPAPAIEPATAPPITAGDIVGDDEGEELQAKFETTDPDD